MMTYQTAIPRSVRLGEAPSFGQTILEYDPHGLAAAAYRRLAEEFVARQRGTKTAANGRGLRKVAVTGRPGFA